jgi:hypothetical protein
MRDRERERVKERYVSVKRCLKMGIPWHSKTRVYVVSNKSSSG